MNYRFVIEEDVDVLYVYELQVDAALRGRGIGGLLLRMSEHLASRTRVRKVMLTVLKRNAAACKFYAKWDYVPSKIDPTFMFPRDEKRYDYRILEKPTDDTGNGTDSET